MHPNTADVYTDRRRAADEHAARCGRAAGRRPHDETARAFAQNAARLAELAEAQCDEATERVKVEKAEYALRRWRADRRGHRCRVATLPLWGSLLAAGVLAAWAVALVLIVIGVAIFLLAALRDDRKLADDGHRGAHRGYMVAAAAVEAVGSAAAWCRRGSRRDHFNRCYAWSCAVSSHEVALLALFDAERGMSYRDVYPLAELTVEEAVWIERGAQAILAADARMPE